HVCHHRRRRLADGATLPFERDIADAVLGIEREIDLYPVTAERIVSFAGVRRAFQRAEMARMARVIEDHFLVQFSQRLIHCYRLVSPPPCGEVEMPKRSGGISGGGMSHAMPPTR